MNLTLGADPELFIKSGDSFVSAHSFVLGTKRAPLPVLGGAVQHDGTAAEFNIDPASSADEFLGNIRGVMRLLTEMIEGVAIANDLPEVTLLATPIAVFSQKHFDSLPAEVKELGCDPDFNAWDDLAENPKPRVDFPMRTGGGHVHIGWREPEPVDDAHKNECAELVKQLDAILFPMSHLWDDNDLRRRSYGTMGAYRPKEFGVEYRPLSNAWVGDDDLVKWIFNATVMADEALASGEKYHQTNEFADFLCGPSREQALHYHEVLVDDGFPSLPEKYL